MPIFKYKALDREKRTIAGLVEAENIEFAEEILKDKGFFIVYLSLESEGGAARLGFLNRVKLKEVVIFSRQFSVLISANVPLVQSLKILVEQTTNPKLKVIISQVADEVDAGSRLSDALAKRSSAFSDFYVSVIKSGETSGKLDEVLNYLADEMEKDFDMMSKIKGAMIYPAFVLSGLGVVGALMLTFIVPKLTDIMSESGGELPLATRILIGASDFMANYWWLLIAVIIGVVIGARLFIRTEQGRTIFDTIALRMPVFGKLLQRIYLVRFTRSMKTLIAGGVTIVKSLEISGDVVGNSIYKRLITDTIKEVEDGNSISAVFVKSKEIPAMVSQMMSIGEKTGKLDVILSRVTDFYGREIENIVANLMTLMEPIIMVVMGVGVGLMVAAIIMPMYNMASQF
ncbi:MAG: type II secretion system F family protein [Patescibacteria group bacterium]|jgi:type IV pilus assembly protein PilC